MKINKIIASLLATLCLSSCGKIDLNEELALLKSQDCFLIDNIERTGDFLPLETGCHVFTNIQSFEINGSTITNEYKEMNIDYDLFNNFVLIIDVLLMPTCDLQRPKKGYSTFTGAKIDNDSIVTYYHYKEHRDITTADDRQVLYLFWINKSLMVNVQYHSCYRIELQGRKNTISTKLNHSNETILFNE